MKAAGTPPSSADAEENHQNGKDKQDGTYTGSNTPEKSDNHLRQQTFFHDFQSRNTASFPASTKEKKRTLPPNLFKRRRKLFTAGFLTLLLKISLIVTILLAGAGTIAAFAYYHAEAGTIENLHNSLPKDSLRIYDSQGNVISEKTDYGEQDSIPLSSVSKHVVNATVAIEDKDFWTNQGIDFGGIIRATIDDMRSGHIISGASTITQQLVKNTIVGSNVSYSRKLKEIILALGITHQYSKSQILEMYLNTIYYGEQAYGIDAAAHTYFNLSDSSSQTAASQLDLAQASMLAGIPSSPDTYNPFMHPATAFARQDQVLQSMVHAGYINQSDADAAENEAHKQGFLQHTSQIDNAPHFSNYVTNELNQLIDTGDVPLSRSGLKVYTTLNLGLQEQIQKIAQQHIRAMSAHNMTNAAAVMLDYHTGAILTLLGSIDYNNASIGGQFDAATQAFRQPGSSFKPFVYATAFQEGWSPGTYICDCPIAIPIPGGPPYQPQNYDHKFHGEQTLRNALQNSLNIPAVKTLMFAGIQNSLTTAQRMGIDQYQGTPGPSMVLGGLGVRLIDETSAYGVFANGGVRVPPHAINLITDSSGKILYQYHAPQGQKVISPQISYLITNVLEDNNARKPEFGDCSPLQLGPVYSSGGCANARPAAAKTGTTNDFKDNWTVGYTTDYVMGVWAGNNDGSPMYNVSGIDGAAPIWHDSMILAEQGHPDQNFAAPPGIEQATVHYNGGGTSTDWYIDGTVPTSGIDVNR